MRRGHRDFCYVSAAHYIEEGGRIPADWRNARARFRRKDRFPSIRAEYFYLTGSSCLAKIFVADFSGDGARPLLGLGPALRRRDRSRRAAMGGAVEGVGAHELAARAGFLAYRDRIALILLERLDLRVHLFHL